MDFDLGLFHRGLSLAFGIRCAASHCQDVTSLVTMDLTRQGLSILNYIDDVWVWVGGGGVASTYTTAVAHFTKLQGVLDCYITFTFKV